MDGESVPSGKPFYDYEDSDSDDDDQQLMAEIGADRLVHSSDSDSDSDKEANRAKRAGDGSYKRKYERKEVFRFTQQMIRDVASKPAKQWSVLRKPTRTIGGGYFYTNVWRQEGDIATANIPDKVVSEEDSSMKKRKKKYKKYMSKMMKLKGIKPVTSEEKEVTGDNDEQTETSVNTSTTSDMSSSSTTRKETRASRSAAEKMANEKLKPKKPAKVIYKCPLDGCSKKFTSRVKLKSHIEAHIGTMPYVCPWLGCNHRFSTASDLKGHVTQHEKMDTKKVVVEPKQEKH